MTEKRKLRKKEMRPITIQESDKRTKVRRMSKEENTGIQSLNNSFADAEWIDEGQNVMGYLDDHLEYDYYDIFFGNHTVGLVTVEPQGDYSLDVQLYDEYENRLGYVYGERGQFISVRIPLKLGQNFYVRVALGESIPTGQTASYRLRCDKMENIVEETSSSNDDFNDAQRIQVYDTVLGWIDEEYDWDIYEIIPKESGIMRIKLQPSDEHMRMDLYVYDQDEDLIDDDGGLSGRQAELEINVRAGRSYYIEASIRSDYDSGLQYVLHTEMVGIGGGSNDFSDVRITKISANKTEPFPVGQTVEFTVTLKNYAQYECPITYVNAKTKEGLVVGVSASAIGILPNKEVTVKLPITRREEGTELIIFEITSNPLYSSSKHFTWGVVGPLKTLVDQYIASNPSLTTNEKAALNKIGLYGKEKICKGATSANGTIEYLTTTVTDMFNKGELLLFSMEGAGSYTNLNNPRHPNGRYGALTVVIKNKKIIALERETSTIPDYAFQIEGIPKISYTTTADPGVYEAVSGLHQSSVSAIRVCNNRYMPSSIGTKSKRSKTKAVGINFHRGYNTDNPNAPSSEGCLLISKPAAQAFYEKIGVVNSGVSIDTCKFNSLTCVVVINRDLFNPDMVQGMA